ncbi:c-type cytochrome [Mucilaginibacter jinjuensis]|uniref:Cytochrome c n=1 Tax=Mucilaginibacter jinjuensis TaxID=1176721 RepID=A0ABY7T123_9SPHI|nr:cytochrome c [Mucilaginibacter jinjuensis]WCT10124.1 cytochrome c [Mucilaginibacter jinjuensis]
MTVYFRSLLLIAFCFLAIGSYAQQHKKTAAKKPAASLSSSIAAGQKVYMQYCVSCHQVDGGGVQHMNPPLIKTTYVLGDKSKIIKIVLHGFSEDVDINGDSYSNTMPSFDMLKDQEIADVLTYVRNSFTNKASAVKVSEVTALRGKK